ncbi:hypothetical protein [Candidatus Mycoplasma mahonii]|uniref:hypothetical protein n=1 Tax=Candidatus Mycoplasma mahonii TaxID=3004105 RepID=UPI0026F28FC5|nr:hypothetical protein [Candidatus Mycoplasma mahonii]WKX02160.1 hypothetical protein O3I44_02030 [Candidatus Mycoplasma mahonii]
MELKQYTDEKYVPLNDLSAFGDSIVNQIIEYRRSFTEMVQITDLDFVNIVETPKLVKKRYSVNVELKGSVDIEAKDNDFILSISINLVLGKEVKGISVSERSDIFKKYKENGNDLTIVTNYLINHVDKLIYKTSKNELDKLLPSITKKDKKFIEKYYDSNLNYAIEDYQDINKSSYETARQGLERLTNLKLYIKTKVAKKFIYKPSIKLNKIMKGGN